MNLLPSLIILPREKEKRKSQILFHHVLFSPSSLPPLPYKLLYDLTLIDGVYQ